MGPDPRPPIRCRLGDPPLTRIAQVVPSLATFAVDDGFSYRIPDTLGGVTVGSLVRIPLGGRRTRGYVTHVRDGVDPGNLRDILGVVGDLAVFTPKLLETLRWTAIHYVAPLAVMLGAAAPPNAPKRRRPGDHVVASRPSPLPGVTAVAAGGQHVRSQYLVGGGPWAPLVAGLVADVLAADRNAAVIAPTLAEARALVDDLAPLLGFAPFLASSSEPAASVTRAWAGMAMGGGQMVVGTREVALWPLGDVGMVIVVEEGRPAMTAPQTPTTSVRDIMRRRATVERFPVVFAGPVPTVEAIASGTEIHESAARVWPLVEVIDRSEEPPGGSVVMQATSRAVAGAVRAGGEVFVFVPRRGDAAAFRCVSCGTLRACANCGAGASRSDRCARCDQVLGACGHCGGGRFQALGAGIGSVIAELRRSLGDDVGTMESGAAVRVGTERDIPYVRSGLPGDTTAPGGPTDGTPARRMALSVVIDADTLILAPHYRAEEDALSIMARVALTVDKGRGHRCLIQTGQHRHRVFEALRSGRPTDLLGQLLAERETGGFPPVTQLMAIEITGPAPGAAADLEAAAGDGVGIHGPATTGDAVRWLVSGGDLRPFKVLLRGQVQRWRDGGAKVRIDADPVRL